MTPLRSTRDVAWFTLDIVKSSGRGDFVTKYRVGYIVGSLSQKSINRTLSKALIRLAPSELEFVEIPIKDLPLYNHDYDADYPPEGRALKEALAAVDAILFVTPEYNRSIPGALKNAIGKDVFPRRQQRTPRHHCDIGCSLQLSSCWL